MIGLAEFLFFIFFNVKQIGIPLAFTMLKLFKWHAYNWLYYFEYTLLINVWARSLILIWNLYYGTVC